MDTYSWIFLFSVLVISLSVFVFRFSYMHLSTGFSKFHLLVAAFVVSILLLILSPNFITLIIGWDGLGISSFFLVIFYKRNKTFNAGLITALTNRAGDALILISLTMFFPLPSLTIPLGPMWECTLPLLMLIILLLAASTKRAQVPFRAWLPAAIAAPTPVSALVHSSTLVTAGVYLLFRLGVVASRPWLSIILGGLGGTTTLIASLGAFLESDLKKIVALSTLSQLGVIVISLRIGLPLIAFFHLVVHAFFKALLFISTGNIIHNSNDYQDLRRNGSLGGALPSTQATVVLAKLRLCGVPFFSAYYSKELVLESLSRGSAGTHFWVYLLIWTGVMFTILYSLRFIFYTLSVTQGPALFWKSDGHAPVLAAQCILVIPGVTTGNLLAFSLINELKLPLVSTSSKIRVISLLIFWAPVLFLFFRFSPNFSYFKSIFYLFFLSSWRGALPLSILSSYSNSNIWLRRFGWKDLLLGRWLFKSGPDGVVKIARTKSLFMKTFLLRVVLFIIWFAG